MFRSLSPPQTFSVTVDSCSRTPYSHILSTRTTGSTTPTISNCCRFPRSPSSSPPHFPCFSTAATAARPALDCSQLNNLPPLLLMHPSKTLVSSPPVALVRSVSIGVGEGRMEEEDHHRSRGLHRHPIPKGCCCSPHPASMHPLYAGAPRRKQNILSTPAPRRTLPRTPYPPTRLFLPLFPCFPLHHQTAPPLSPSIQADIPRHNSPPIRTDHPDPRTLHR